MSLLKSIMDISSASCKNRCEPCLSNAVRGGQWRGRAFISQNNTLRCLSTNHIGWYRHHESATFLLLSWVDDLRSPAITDSVELRLSTVQICLFFLKINRLRLLTSATVNLAFTFIPSLPHVAKNEFRHAQRNQRVSSAVQ